MRWKIIVVNSGIILTIAVISYVVLAMSIKDVVSNQSDRKRDVVQALRAANAQLALDALRLERWLDERVASSDVRGVFSAGTAQARQESATAQANKLRDSAISEPAFEKMAPALVLFVDAHGVALGRNGSALMRGDRVAAVYAGLGKVLKSGTTASDLWLNRQRQEQMLASYAPVRGDDGSIVGAVVIGTPLNDERLARTSDLTSGQTLVFALASTTGGVEIVAHSGDGGDLIGAVAKPPIRDAALGAVSGRSIMIADGVVAGEIAGAVALEGYGESNAVLVAAVPASLVGNLAMLLGAPIFGVAAIGIVLVAVGGFLLGNYVSAPISELEDGLLAIINGNSALRFQIEHAELGGLVFRINSLLNALMGVAEDTTDEEGRPSTSPSANMFQEALSVDESAATTQAVDPGIRASLAAEPADRYYRRLYQEYIGAKRQLGDPVDHITFDAFVTRIRASEQQMSEKHGRPVRFQVQLKDGAVVLNAVTL
jgi:hypothetical protein